MNRAELVEILASKNDLSKAAANAVLETLIDTIQTAVKKGDAVQLVGFGTFKSAKRAARTGKNPSTGAALKIPASTVPKFVAGAKFKAVVDPKAAKRKADKPAKADNGMRILIPPYMEAGERVLVSTETGEYVRRAD